jgi:hypothetical protein
MNESHSTAADQQNKVEIQVITTSGNYPAGDEYGSYNMHEKLSTVLHQAARELKLQGTDSWQAKDGERVLDPNRTLAENGITSKTQIYWAPVESGGGACTRT